MDILIDAATGYQPFMPIGPVATALNNINTDGQDTQQITSQIYAFPHGYRYVHLCHIPMFPLYGSADTLALQKAQQRKANELAQLIPESLAKDRIVMTALHLSTGGASLSTDRKLKNGLVKFRAGATQMTMDQNKMCVLTRWAVRPGTEKMRFFVDVLEYRCADGGVERKSCSFED